MLDICRLLQHDIDIAHQAKEHKIPVLFVRSKADQVSIHNEKDQQ